MKSLFAKLIVIAVLMAGLLVPLQLIKSLAAERAERKDLLIKQMSAVWGMPQTFSEISIHGGGKKIMTDSLRIEGVINAEIRNKGIYSLPFYSARLSVSARFPRALFSGKKKRLEIKISDKSAVKINKLAIGGTVIHFYDISADNKIIRIPMPAGIKAKNGNVSVEMDVKGIDQLHFLPSGKNFHLVLKSSWDDPNFSGAFLPTSRKISSEGFEAEWIFKNKFHMAEGTDSSFGINLYIPVDNYQKTERSIKYGILFIFLTFLAFFLFEVLVKLRIHPLQYLLVGFALIIFYLLLLSLSEHINFIVSYLIASVATITLITLYCLKILKEKTRSTVLTIILSVLYSFLLTLLHLEEYSLLFGSIGIFGILAVVMYLTRDIDWYKVSHNAIGGVGEEADAG